jgi:hypothetical protein
MRRALKITVAALLALAVYAGTFSWWWLRSPVKVVTQSGIQYRVVDFQYNKILWHTEIVWAPAFWFMKHVRGYREVAFMAMEDKSIWRYAKKNA